MGNKTDVMLDLETLGNGPNSVIIAIGAVAFDRDGLGEEFYTRVDAQSCVDAGLQMDVSTVMWWMQQSDAARAEFKKDCVPLAQALLAFSRFIAESTTGQQVKVWGNGASFDNVILSNAYRALRIEQPWKFWNDRCYRTVKACAPDVPRVEPTIAHHALADAVAQAQHLIRIGIGLGG